MIEDCETGVAPDRGLTLLETGYVAFVMICYLERLVRSDQGGVSGTFGMGRTLLQVQPPVKT